MSEPISKDCKHCEHLTAYWEDTAGEHKRWQCCHCGRIRSEYAPISRGFDTVWETGGHGPFLPQPRLAESKLDHCLRVVREYVSSELADDPSQDDPSCQLYPLIELVRECEETP